MRALYVIGKGCSLLGTFMIHMFLYRRYAVSLLVRYFDCLSINLQLFTGLLCFGESWRSAPISLCSLGFLVSSCVFLTLETIKRWNRVPSNDGIKFDAHRSRVEWYRLYVTAGQGAFVILMAVIVERASFVSVASGSFLFLGLAAFGFGNQFKIELPWDNAEVWGFHDDFHLCIVGTQICTLLVACRTTTTTTTTA